MTCRGSAISARTPRSPGQRKASPSNRTGPVVQIRAPDGRIRRRRDERVAVDHHRHNREWTRVAAARVSEMPEPPHLVQWHRRPRYTMNRATGRRSGVGAELKFSVAASVGSHGRCLLRRYGGVARRQSGIPHRTHDRAPRPPPPWGVALCRSRFGARNRGKVGRFDELRAGAGCVAPPLAVAAAGRRRRRRPRRARVWGN
jgi:hypothetical protein